MTETTLWPFATKTFTQRLYEDYQQIQRQNFHLEFRNRNSEKSTGLLWIREKASCV